MSDTLRHAEYFVKQRQQITEKTHRSPFRLPHIDHPPAEIIDPAAATTATGQSHQ